MKTRKAVKEDIKNGLLDLFYEGYEFHRKNREDKFKLRTKKECEKIVLDMLINEEVIVVLEENKIIGYAAYKIKKNVDKKSLWIDEIIINENYRNKGYGKEIIKFLEEVANKNKCCLVELSCWCFNKNALEIYKYLGFKEQRIIFEKNI